jgi:GTP-binding protein
MYRYKDKIQTTLSYMTYSPVVFISALTGLRINKLFETLNMVIQNHSLRVATGVLNDILYDAMAMNQPPSDKGKRLKIYYMTQVSVKPPTFVLFVNDKQLMHFSYLRYIENQIREAFGFKGTPLRLLVRERKEK